MPQSRLDLRNFKSLPHYPLTVFSVLCVLYEIGASEEMRAKWIKAFKNLKRILHAPFVIRRSKMAVRYDWLGNVEFEMICRTRHVDIMFFMHGNENYLDCIYDSGLRWDVLYLCDSNFSVANFLTQAAEEGALTQAQSDAYLALL